MGDLLWPTYDGPHDLAAIEEVPLTDRGLPGTTYELLVRAAGLWPNRVALSVLPDGERWEQPSERTFAELLADVHRFANVFHALGVRRTDGVALLAPNSDELITATLAAELAGIAAPINSGLSGEHIAELLRRSGARVLVAAGPDLAPEVWDRRAGASPWRPGSRTCSPYVRPGASAAEPGLLPIDGVRVGHLSALAAEQPHDRFVGEPPSATDLAALFHTGGTTGTPKLAAHTHANEVSDAWMIAAIGLLDAESVVFAALPLFHVNALVVTLLAPLFKGQRVVWAGPLGYRDTKLFANFWKVVERYRISFMSGVPTIYAALADRPVDADISSLRFALVGASPLPKAVREKFESATGVPLLEGYGLTEATCASARSFVDHPVPGSVGQRLPYQQVKTIEVTADGEWVDLPTGEVGVLAIGGPTVFPGYVVDRGPDGPVLDGLGKLRERLARHRRPCLGRRRRFRPPRRTCQGPDHQGWSQHRPGRDRERVDGTPGGYSRAGGGSSRRPLRRGACRVRHPRRRHRSDPRGTARLGLRPRARAGRGPQDRHRAGHDPRHPRRQALQARPARRGDPRGRRRSAAGRPRRDRRAGGGRGRRRRHGRRADGGSDKARIKETLDRFAITYRMEKS